MRIAVLWSEYIFFTSTCPQSFSEWLASPNEITFPSTAQLRTGLCLKTRSRDTLPLGTPNGGWWVVPVAVGLGLCLALRPHVMHANEAQSIKNPLYLPVQSIVLEKLLDSLRFEPSGRHFFPFPLDRLAYSTFEPLLGSRSLPFIYLPT